jgi:hypothetical protein
LERKLKSKSRSKIRKDRTCRLKFVGLCGRLYNRYAFVISNESNFSIKQIHHQ